MRRLEPIFTDGRQPAAMSTLMVRGLTFNTDAASYVDNSSEPGSGDDHDFLFDDFGMW
jgi:hypothetical protein